MAISTCTAARPRSLRRSAFAVLAAAGLSLGTSVALAPSASASGGGSGGTVALAAAPAVAAPTGAAQVAVDTALAQLGDPYVWAGSGPDVFDCSGLTQFSYAAAGIRLPHSSQQQSTIGTPVA